MNLYVVFAYGSDPGDPPDSLVAIVPGDLEEAKQLAQKERIESKDPLSWRRVNGVEGRAEWAAYTPAMRYAIVELRGGAAQPSVAAGEPEPGPDPLSRYRCDCGALIGGKEVDGYYLHQEQHGPLTQLNVMTIEPVKLGGRRQ